MAERSSDLSELSAMPGPSMGESSRRQLSVSPSPGSSVSKSNTSQPRKSLVWNYFEYDEELNKSLCQVLKSPTSSDCDLLSDPLGSVCGHEIPGKFPTNLKQHLKKAHPGPYTELIKNEAQEKEAKIKQSVVKQKSSLKVSQQLTLSQTLQSRIKYDRSNDRYKSLTRKLAIFIGTSNIPNSLVEN